MKHIEILQDLYDSEINFVIASPCWDAGVTIAIGPKFPYAPALIPDNYEYISEGHSILGAIEHLVEKAIEIYPDSTFASRHSPEIPS